MDFLSLSNLSLSNLSLSNRRGSERVTRVKKVKTVGYAKSKERPLLNELKFPGSGYPVEITQFSARQEMTPLLSAELAGLTFRAVGIANKNRLAATCHSYACAALTRTRNEPDELILS
jgi:hypothetical protein